MVYELCVIFSYVLPKHMLLQIAEVLPKEMQGILACCNPIPPLVKTELLTLHTIIREAREQPMIDVSLSSEITCILLIFNMSFCQVLTVR